MVENKLQQLLDKVAVLNKKEENIVTQKVPQEHMPFFETHDYKHIVPKRTKSEKSYETQFYNTLRKALYTNEDGVKTILQNSPQEKVNILHDYINEIVSYDDEQNTVLGVVSIFSQSYQDLDWKRNISEETTREIQGILCNMLGCHEDELTLSKHLYSSMEIMTLPYNQIIGLHKEFENLPDTKVIHHLEGHEDLRYLVFKVIDNEDIPYYQADKEAGNNLDKIASLLITELGQQENLMVSFTIGDWEYGIKKGYTKYLEVILNKFLSSINDELYEHLILHPQVGEDGNVYVKFYLDHEPQRIIYEIIIQTNNYFNTQDAFDLLNDNLNGYGIFIEYGEEYEQNNPLNNFLQIH